MTSSKQTSLALHPGTTHGARSASAFEGTDRQALAAVRGGSVAAFEAIYAANVAACLRLAQRVLRDEHLAQDAVQEAFFELWSKRASIDPGRTSARAWTILLTHRRAVDRVRYERLRARPSGDAPETGSSIDVAELALLTVQAESLQRLLAGLPLRQRTDLVLAYWGGYTMAEIATSTNAPLGSVKTRVRSGLIQLRRLMEQVDEPSAG